MIKYFQFHRLIITSLVVLLGLTANGQSISINIELKGDWQENASVKLIAYNTFSSTEMVSEGINESNAFTIPDSITSSIFLLNVQLNGNKIYNQEIIYASKPVELTLTKSQNQITSSWQNDELNSGLNSYKQQSDSMLNRMVILNNLAQQYLDKQSAFYGKLALEQKNALDGYNGFVSQNAQEKNELAYYALATKVNLPPTSLSPEQHLGYMIDHFFDSYSPLIPLYKNSQFYKQKLDEYMALVFKRAQNSEALDEAVIIKNTDQFLYRIEEDPELTKETVYFLRDQFYKLGLEDICYHLDTSWLASRCNASDDIDLQLRLNNYERLALGNKAPEIEALNQRGEEFKLNNINADRTIIVFWASWCQHCSQELPILHTFFSALDNIKIVAIALDANADEWTKAIQNYPNWEHIRAADIWEDQIVKDYAIYATPTMYVLDDKQRIKAKATNFNELKNSL